MAQNLSIGAELANVPFSDLVSNIATSIAEAQLNLDTNSIEILKKMGDVENHPVDLPYTVYENTGEKSEFRDEVIKTSMIGAGFQPTFYQFAETIIEIKMAISASLETINTEENKGTKTTTDTVEQRRGFLGLQRKKKTVVTTTPINATYTNKYNYTAEGTSTLRTRLVPVPPNTIIERFIDLKSQFLTLKYQAEMAKYQQAIDQKASDVANNVEALEPS